MIEKGMTIKDVAHQWVREFDAIQQGMIKKLMDAEPDDWNEITLPVAGNRVYVYDESESGEVIKQGKSKDKFRVKLDSGKEIWVKKGDFEIEFDERLPMWGTMWSFSDSLDTHWLEEEDGLEAMSECGFRIFESEEFGCFFGIDGAGYDFYEAHWIPLYKARGLKWHDPETEVKAS